MKEISLTHGYVALVDDEDYELVAPHRWLANVVRRPNQEEGIMNVYASKAGPYIPGEIRLMHRLILGLTDRKILVDHKNHNGLDNRRANIRIATPQQNVWSRRKSQDSGWVRYSSTYRGVSRYCGRWKATASLNGKPLSLGIFADEREAALAFDAFVIRHRGEFANPNFAISS